MKRVDFSSGLKLLKLSPILMGLALGACSESNTSPGAPIPPIDESGAHGVGVESLGTFTADEMIFSLKPRPSCGDDHQLDPRIEAGQTMKTLLRTYDGVNLREERREVTVDAVNEDRNSITFTWKNLDGAPDNFVQNECWKSPGTDDAEGALECRSLARSETDTEGANPKSLQNCYIEPGKDFETVGFQSEYGTYQAFNGPQVNAVRVQVITSGEILCQQEGDEVSLGLGTLTTVEIETTELPSLPLDFCGSYRTKLFSFSEIKKSSGEVLSSSSYERYDLKIPGL